MITISLCMIVKNEEDVIGRCLDSVKDLVDEINIIDTGSEDQTKKIVGNYTDRIFDFVWIDDFAAARNFAFQQATKEYVLWLDADDIFTEEDQEKFKLLKENFPPGADAISMKYNLSFDEEGNVSFFSRRNRLVKRENHFQWIGAVHEYLEVSGKIHNSEVAVTHASEYHDSDRNINIYRKMVESGKELSARDTFYFANELMDHQHYKEAIQYYESFLASQLGWIEDNIRACFKLADCYHHLDDKTLALKATLRTFEYDVPRPEACCRLGYFFMEQGKNHEAIHWYSQALKNISQHHPSFQIPSFSTWLPHLQLCVLYDRLKQFETAYKHNELARTYKPNDERILYNKRYFEKILQLKKD